MLGPLFKKMHRYARLNTIYKVPLKNSVNLLTVPPSFHHLLYSSTLENPYNESSVSLKSHALLEVLKCENIEDLNTVILSGSTQLC